MAHVVEVLQRLNSALALRKKRVAPGPTEALPPAPAAASQDPSCLSLQVGHHGIMEVRGPTGELLFDVPSLAEFYEDSNELFRTRSAGPVATYCHQRLRLLQTRFELYCMLCGDREQEEVASVGHRDFYNVRKVDTHIHHSAAMNGKHLLRFMKKKLKKCSSDIVEHTPDGKGVTLGEVFRKLGISWDDLSLDRLQVWADRSCMHRFDRFNNKYSPMGQNALRNVFLKTDNALGGRYLAELTQEMLDDLIESKYQNVEWRLSIYGRKNDEWLKLSRWVLGRDGKGLGGNRALLSPNLRWMIQIPRLFALYKDGGMLTNFREMLANIFQPVFEATLFPERHRDIADFLAQVSGFDTVDDESSSGGRTFSSKDRMPGDWDIPENPSYRYYCFHIWANLHVLNRLRRARGLNTFGFRPHAGEAGEVHHLDTAFLLADGINHGLNLRKSPPLEYLFFLAQVGIAMSPCSNNQLFLHYEKSPFPTYFARGLNVSLSTDDPLMFHQTKEPLMEEYSIAKQIWHLTSVDLCEIARNSVVQSGFPESDKEHWLGCKNYWEDCSVTSTNVPPLRQSFRRQQMTDELQLLNGITTLDKMDASIAELLLLSPKGGRMTSSSSALAFAVDDDCEHEVLSQRSASRALLSPLPDDGFDQTDSDLLGANGEEKDSRLSPLMSPVYAHGPPELVLASELEKLTKVFLPEGAAPRKRTLSPRPSAEDDRSGKRQTTPGSTNGAGANGAGANGAATAAAAAAAEPAKGAAA